MTSTTHGESRTPTPDRSGAGPSLPAGLGFGAFDVSVSRRGRGAEARDEKRCGGRDIRDGSIEGFAIRELSMFDAGRLYPGILCARKAIGVTSVGHDDSNFEIDTIVGDLVDKGLQVTAGTGDQDCSFQK